MTAPTRHDLEQAWLAMHGANIAAHKAGFLVRGQFEPNPHPEGTDLHYWWREGHHGRPFAVITDTHALLAYLAHHGTVSIRFGNRRRHHTTTSPGPHRGKRPGPGDAHGVVHPTELS